MDKNLYSILAIFPTPNVQRTAGYYNEILGFKVVEYLDVKEPHICLYRDNIEIILTKAKSEKVYPNRELYGYGEDIYIVTDNQEALQNEFSAKGADIVRPLHLTDYNNLEFVLEDIDRRWLAFGIKQKLTKIIKE